MADACDPVAARSLCAPFASAWQHQFSIGQGLDDAMATNGISPAVVCFPFVGDTLGGSSISALNLIRHLDRDRYEPLILMHQVDGAAAKLFTDEEVAFEAAPLDGVASGTRRGDDLRYMLAKSGSLARFLRERRVSIVHTNDGRMHATWGVPARLAGARLLWHHRADPRAAGLRFLAPWIADRVVSVSKFSSPQPGLISAARKCDVIHSPFDTDSEPPERAPGRQAILEEFGCRPDAHVVGFVGNMITRKRPLMFVEAIGRMLARDPGLHIAAPMFGEEREETEQVLDAIERHGLGAHVRLMGFRYPPETWIAGLDVLLVPAVKEPFGRSLIEAMLLRTPLIAADSGGNPEIIRHGETGYLVPPDDPDAMAERTLAFLGDDPARRSIAAAARDDALARFGMQRHAQSIMQIYDDLLTH
ncbi:MAG: glycosyltransferase family 4 protein [Pseudomonadota bacterium]